MAFHLGRKPPLFAPRHMRASLLVNQVLASFGAPPPKSAPFTAAVKVPWGIYLNDKLGDCVCAYAAHALLMRTANVGTAVIATDDDVLKLYEVIGGYNPSDPNTDQGCQESDLCQYMIDTGFLGHKSAGTAPIVAGVITPTSIDYMKWATQVFVGIQLGVNLPASAQNQFPNQPWDVGGDETIEGGHCVGMFGYDEQYAYLSTWGAIQPATWAWVNKFVEEAHADLFLDAIRASGTTPAGFGPHTLARDLAALAAS